MTPAVPGSAALVDKEDLGEDDNKEDGEEDDNDAEGHVGSFAQHAPWYPAHFIWNPKKGKLSKIYFKYILLIKYAVIKYVIIT